MPLRALVGGREVQVWDLSRKEWADLRRLGRADAGAVLMACCGVPGLAKVSRNGNPFFSHRSGRRDPAGAAPPCRWSGESAAHLHCKALAAAGAQAVGWEVRTEAAARDGSWRADILCRRGAATVALEIQLARTAPGEIMARQDRYREAGIRGAWFIPTPLCPAPSRQLPAFPLEATGGAGKGGPGIGDVGVPRSMMRLDGFVARLLRGRVRFEEERVARPLACPVLVTAPDGCRRCGGPFQHIVGVANHRLTAARPRYRVEGTPILALRDLWEAGRGQARALAEAVGRLRRRERALSPLAPRRCPAVGEHYLTALCPACGAAQGDRAVDRLLTSLHPRVPIRIPIPLTPLAFRPLDGRPPRPGMGDWLERVIPARWRLEREGDGDAGRPETCPRHSDPMWPGWWVAIADRHEGRADRSLPA